MGNRPKAIKELNNRARTRDSNDPLGGSLLGVDGRTYDARRFRELMVDWASYLGGVPSPPQLALLRRAAVLCVWCEEQERKFLSGEDDLDVKNYGPVIGRLGRLAQQLDLPANVIPGEAVSIEDYIKGKE